MKLESVGTVIATRNIDCDGGELIRIIIGSPQEDPEGNDYFCPIQILGLGNEKVRSIYGADTVQALELALKLIGTDLYTSDAFKAGRLRYLGRKNLGFPVPSIIADLVPPENE